MSHRGLRYMWRHPARWAVHWWLHLTVAAVLVTIAVAWTSDIYDQVRAGMLWPIAVGGTATLVLASALAPLEDRLVAVVSASMLTLGVVRALAYLEVLVTTDIAAPLLVGLAGKWLLFAALGVAWPGWTRAAGTAYAVEVGEDRA